MTDTLDANRIADYLTAHPDFFNQFPNLLTSLRITHPHGTHAVSITERQVLSMRDKVQMLEGKLAELIHFGEENDAISEKMHRLALDIVAATDQPSLLAALDRHLKQGFAVPHHALRLWHTADAAAHHPVSESLKNEARAQMHPSCGALKHAEAQEWFGDASAHLKSFAAIPLNPFGTTGEHTVGLLVLASEDAQRFYPEMGTLYLDRLGQLLGAALTRLG
mgnify:CR=1 FL=1